MAAGKKSTKTRASKSKRSKAKSPPISRRTTRRGTAKSAAAKWSAQVAKTSDALDLQPGIFKLRSAHAIALALKKSAEASQRRKATPFRSAMSMLNFEVNRAGKGLSATRRQVLEQAKIELRKVFHRPPS